jgi:hypothetical protein
VAADHSDIARGAVAAAIGAAPCSPARLIDWHRRERCLEHRSIGERNLGRHGLAFGRKAKRRMICPADPAAPIDEGIEHHVEKLVGGLEGDFLRAGRGLAGKLVQGIGEIAAG